VPHLLRHAEPVSLDATRVTLPETVRQTFLHCEVSPDAVAIPPLAVDIGAEVAPGSAGTGASAAPAH